MTVFIRTTETSGMDRYSQEIAQRLTSPVLTVDRYDDSEEARARVVRQLARMAEVVHFPNQHFGTMALRTRRFIITVHDLERLMISFDSEAPEDRANLVQDIAAIGQASHVVAVSQATKRDLIERMRVPEERITVTYNGVDHSVFRRHRVNGETPKFPYVLYVGSERERKNLRRMLEAFAVVKRDPRFADLRLVKIGGPGRNHKFRADTLRAIDEQGLRNDVVLVDAINDRALASYYAAAQALIYPSLYEGFGLPVAEAMASGCPVIVSNLTSLPEIAGEAGLLVDPYDIREMASAMIRVVTDQELASDMVSRGLVRARRFSWDDAAKATAEVHRKVESLARKRDRVADVIGGNDNHRANVAGAPALAYAGACAALDGE